MKKVLLSLMVLAMVAGFSNSATAQIKIGYISTEELIGSMPETEDANGQLQDYQSSLQAQGADYYKEYVEKDSIFQADSAKWTPTQRELKRNDLFALVQKVQGWQQTMQQMLQEKSQTLIGPIRAKATDAIKATAKENGYTYVLEEAAVLVGPQGDNILALVKKKLGIGAPKPAAGAAPAKKP
jgi:outer membrane protein